MSPIDALVLYSTFGTAALITSSKRMVPGVEMLRSRSRPRSRTLWQSTGKSCRFHLPKGTSASDNVTGFRRLEKRWVPRARWSPAREGAALRPSQLAREGRLPGLVTRPT